MLRSMERQNSIESVKDSEHSGSTSSSSSNHSSPSGSVTSGDEGSEEEEENLVSILKQQTFLHPNHQKKREQCLRFGPSALKPKVAASRALTLAVQRKKPLLPKRSSSSSSRGITEIDTGRRLLGLCSIPEDGQSTRLYCQNEEDDEPTYHRSPVTFDNGYRPSLVNDSSSLSESSSLDEDPNCKDAVQNRPISLWCVLAVLSALLRWILIVLCFVTLFIFYVLLTHPQQQSNESSSSSVTPAAVGFFLEERPPFNSDSAFCPKSEDAEVEAESPTSSLQHLTEALKEEKSPDDELYVVKATPMTSLPPAFEATEAAADPPVKEEPEPINSMNDSELSVNVTQEVIDEEIDAGAVTNASIEDVTPAEEANKTEPAEEIPSFREWTQKALEEEQKKREEEKRKRDEEKEKKKREMQQNLMNNAEGSKENTTRVSLSDSNHGAHQISRLKKNFASLDCGAKVAAANSEAQSALNIITPSRDEYMLNKCSDKIWFVVELCESIKAFRIEIANFELYSSVPKDVRISMGNVLPGRDKDWTLFGKFEAEDERSIQTFASADGVFGKYVKVEVLSHHGTEHYCPISLFKIYGISEIELIGADEDDDELMHGVHELPVPSTTEASPTGNSLIKMFKEGIQLFVGVFAPNKQVKNMDIAQALNHTSLVGSTFMYDVSCPGCDANSFRDVYFLLAFNYAELQQTLKVNYGLKTSLSSHVCQSYGFNNVTSREDDDASVPDMCSSFSLVEFYATLFGTSRIMALCNVIAIQSGRLTLADSHLILPPWNKSKSNEMQDNHVASDTENKAKESSFDSEPSSSEKTEKKAGKKKEDDKDEDVKTAPGEDLAHQAASSSTSSVAASDSSQIIEIAPTKIVDSSVKAAVNPKISTSTDTFAKTKITPTPASEQKSSELPDQQAPAAPGPEQSEGMKEAPEVVYVPPAGDKITPPSNESPPSNGQSGRESVWQKLSNKIKALERNVSLSSGYLEELSVKYKKQIEDLQLAVRQSGEALAAASKTRELERAEVKDLHDQIGQLKIVVEEVSSRMETMSTWAVVVHSLFLVLEIFIGVLFVFSCLNRRIGSPAQEVVQEADLGKMVSSTPLKRRHSHEEKSVCLSDHHIQELNSCKRRRSLDLNARRNSPFLSSSAEGLSRRQKKKLQRRLSRANAVIQESSPAKEMHNESTGSDWQQVTRSSGNGDVSPVIVPTSSKTDIQLGNMFGLLNNSQHDESMTKPALIVSQSRSNSSQSNRKRLLLYSNGYQRDSAESSRSATPDHRASSTTNSTPSHTANAASSKTKPNGNFAISNSASKNAKKRSKSTSPPRRKTEVTKQKNLFKKFDPENVDWIQKPSKN